MFVVVTTAVCSSTVFFVVRSYNSLQQCCLLLQVQQSVHRWESGLFVEELVFHETDMVSLFWNQVSVRIRRDGRG